MRPVASFPIGKAADYRSSEGLSFQLSGVFVLVYELDEKKDGGLPPRPVHKGPIRPNTKTGRIKFAVGPQIQ